MKCYDLFKLPSLKLLEIVAGSEGLNREIKWIYFSDTVQVEDCAKWLNGNELILITGSHLNGGLELLCSILPLLNTKHISGILLNVGLFIAEIPAELKQQANDLKLPIFSLPWESKLVDVTKEICNFIILGERAATRNVEVLNDLLFREDLKDEDLAQIVLNSDFNFEKPCCIGVIQHEMISSPHAKLSVQDANQIISLEHFVFSQMKTHLKALEISAMMTQHNDMIVMLLPASAAEWPEFSARIALLQEAIRQRYLGLRIHVGMGCAYSSPYDYKRSYREAVKAAQVLAVEPHTIPIAYFEKLGLWGILSDVSDKQLLKNYYYNLLGALLKYDHANNADFLGTLYQFLAHTCHLQETADSLYLHKNTLKYRIAKIEALLGLSLKDPEVLVDIAVAQKIGRLLKLEDARNVPSE